MYHIISKIRIHQGAKPYGNSHSVNAFNTKTDCHEYINNNYQVAVRSGATYELHNGDVLKVMSENQWYLKQRFDYILRFLG